ncbi:MAG: DUF3108 domain-containing protein [Elusimicrobia bacterium]|nr:DUF3108 domain-containing protein [Candidatus Obscuribacterium magneticum]
MKDMLNDWVKPRFLLAGLFFFFVGGGLSGDEMTSNSLALLDPSAAPPNGTPPAVQLKRVVNDAFTVGEEFTFEISYQFVPAGKATLEVREGHVIQGRPSINLISRARSNDFVDVFFKVRDYNISTVDRESLASVGFHQNLHEGHYRVIRTTTIDYQKGAYEFVRNYKGKTTQSTGAIAEPACDILSSFFMARTLPLMLGGEYEFTVFSDEAVYPMKVKVFPKLEKIQVEAGTFECVKVQPFVVGDAIFRIAEGKLFVWMTNDARKMPVLIRSKVAIGSFDAELITYAPN